MRIRRGPTEALVGARPWWKDAHCVVHKPVPLAATIDPALARVTGGTLVTQEGMTMGTVTYMSP